MLGRGKARVTIYIDISCIQRNAVDSSVPLDGTVITVLGYWWLLIGTESVANLILEMGVSYNFTYLLNPLRAPWHTGQKQGSSTLSCLLSALQPDPNSNVVVPVLSLLSSSMFSWVVHTFFCLRCPF